MMRKLSLLALFSLTASCTAEPGGSIQLVNVMKPNQQCVYSPEGKDTLLQGYYDPTAANEMEMTVRINNSMNDKDSDARNNDNNTNIKFSGNDVSMAGFNVCYKLENGISEFGAADSGHAFECDSVINATTGEYREYVTGGGTVEADPKGQSVGAPVRMKLFSKAALQGLFGDAMIPEDLLLRASPNSVARCAAAGVNANGTADSTCSAADTVAVTTLDAGILDGFPWGDWAADDRPSQYVLVVMQGVGVTAAGSTVKTNWFSFSVQLCAGCTQVTANTQCPYAYQNKVCDNNFGSCTYLNPDTSEQVTEGCVSPAGKPDGQTGCPETQLGPTADGSTACTGWQSEIVTYVPTYDGICDISQYLGTNIAESCQEIDPCTGNTGASTQ
jgi:hypothetical protein